MAREPLTAELLRELLNYNPASGVFTRRKACNGHRAGEVAGWTEHGYVRVVVAGVKLYAHQLAWLYMTGSLPRNKMDHLDGNGLNNKFSNIREATDVVNAQNIRAAQKNNQLGVLGVYRKRDRFIARIYFDGEQKIVGRFDTPEEAHAAYVAAKRRHHEGCTI